MIESVWWAVKAGEERRYAFPRAPSAEFAAVLERDGYEIVRLEFPWPDTASAVVSARVVRDAMATMPGTD